MKKISTLIIALVAVVCASVAQPSRSAQLQERLRAAAQRMTAQQHPNRFSEEDLLNSCPDSVVTWEKDEETGEMTPTNKMFFTYDDQKRVLTATEYTYNSDPTEGAIGWALVEKTTNAYNAAGQLATVLVEEAKGSGIENSRETYTYNAAGKVATILYEEFDDGTYTNDSRETFTYDAQGREIESLEEEWEDGSWEKSEKQVKTYEGEKVTTKSYDWEGDQGWVQNALLVTYVNAQGMQYREEDYDMVAPGEFALSTVSEMTFGDEGLPVTIKMYMSDGAGGLVELGSGTMTYEFNAAGQLTKMSMAMKMDFMGIFTNDTLQVTYFYYSGNAHVDNALTEPAVTARRYYGMDGKEASGANRGLYIVVTEYADGTRTTVKTVRR